MDDHPVNHLGNDAMHLLVILEVVRQRFGLADYCLYRAGRVFTDRQCCDDLCRSVQEPLQDLAAGRHRDRGREDFRGRSLGSLEGPQ